MEPDVHFASPRGFAQAFWHVRSSHKDVGVPLVCVHGWPETKRLYLKVIEPLAAAGFDVVVPDLRGFGDSDLAPDGMYDVVSHARDLHALVHDHLGYERVVLMGGDLGGPTIQEIALRYPDWVDRMVLFNSPLPYDKIGMANMRTRAPKETMDYYLRQGTDADGLMAELDTPAKRRAYIAEFYTRRNWAHPGNFSAEDVAFHCEPFGDAVKLRATFANYESVFAESKRIERPLLGRNEVTPTLVYFGVSDNVIYPDFDLMASVVFSRCAGPHRLEECGHFVPWEAPATLVAGTIDFCRDRLAT
jgi:pimeloyl-ACP methyl ester carboxylesterase